MLWRIFEAGTVDAVENLAREGKLRELPGFGEKSETNILKAIEVYKQISGRFLIDFIEAQAAKLTAYITAFGKLVGSVDAAGSYRRGKETIGDLDLLVTLAGKHKQTDVDALAEHILKFPENAQTLAQGENKVSFRLGSGLQVDVRMLEPEN